MTKDQIDEVAKFIETNLFESYLKIDDNIDSIGISAYDCGENCLDYFIVFVVENYEATKIPNEFTVSSVIKLKTDKWVKKTIQKSFKVIETATQDDPVRPGVSIGGRGTGGGTLGAIIYYEGKRHLLSCLHVLGGTNTEVFQPGRSFSSSNFVGKVVRHNAELDCSISSFTKRSENCDLNVLELNIIPLYTRDIVINDKVIKYGVETGKTNGVVKLIKVMRRTKLSGGFNKNQFLVVADPRHRPNNCEISDDGDSGASYFEYSEAINNATPTILGIITDGDSYKCDHAEYAYATEMTAIQKSMNIKFY